MLYGVKPAVTAIVIFAALRIGSRIKPIYFSTNSQNVKVHASYGSAKIDDDTPIPAFVKFSWQG